MASELELAFDGNGVDEHNFLSVEKDPGVTNHGWMLKGQHSVPIPPAMT